MDDAASDGSAGRLWHLCWQAAAGRNLLAHEELAERIRQRILAAHRQDGRELIDYLLMPTEIHLLSWLDVAQTPARLARSVANVTARWVRALHRQRGPVFADRYRARLIGTEDELRQEIRMLAWRPVVLGLCGTPTHHSHSALRTTLGLRRAMGFDARPQLQLFGDPIPQARAALRAWLSIRPSAMAVREWELSRGLLLATGLSGSACAANRAVCGPVAWLVAAAGEAGVDGALAFIERWVLTRLGAPRGVSLSTATGAVGARGRALVACLSADMGLCSAAAVARRYGRSKATLCEQMARCRRQAADKAVLAVPLPRLVEEALAISGAI